MGAAKQVLGHGTACEMAFLGRDNHLVPRAILIDAVQFPIYLRAPLNCSPHRADVYKRTTFGTPEVGLNSEA